MSWAAWVYNPGGELRMELGGLHPGHDMTRDIQTSRDPQPKESLASRQDSTLRYRDPVGRSGEGASRAVANTAREGGERCRALCGALI